MIKTGVLRSVPADSDTSVLASVVAGLHVPARIVLPTSWVGHIPFASWIVSTARPEVVVELGVHTGNSFFTFAEAAARSNLPTMLYGIDTWAGDDHAGAYAEDVFVDVSGIARMRFPHSVVLVRKLFAEAVHDFADGSIDLLHIDGLHTYEAVRDDFETWKPKLSRRAIVLFHDIAVTQEGFGVNRFWAEITAQYPHLAFTYSNGLGMLLVGPDVPDPVVQLVRSPALGTACTTLFAKLGEFLTQAVVHGPDVDALPVNPQVDPPRIYLGANGEFSEDNAIDARPVAGSPGALVAAFTPMDDVDSISLRIDPMHEIGLRGVHRVLLTAEGSGAPLEIDPAAADPKARLTVVPIDAGYLFACTGPDSQWTPRLSAEAREVFRHGARIVFEPIAAPNAALTGFLLKAIGTLVEPLDQRLAEMRVLEESLKRNGVVLPETIDALTGQLQELDSRLHQSENSRVASESLRLESLQAAEAARAEVASLRDEVARTSTSLEALRAENDALAAANARLPELEARVHEAEAMRVASEAGRLDALRAAEAAHAEVAELRDEGVRRSEELATLQAAHAALAATNAKSDLLLRQYESLHVTRSKFQSQIETVASAVLDSSTGVHATVIAHQAVAGMTAETDPLVSSIGKAFQCLLHDRDVARARMLVTISRPRDLAARLSEIDIGDRIVLPLVPMRGVVALDTTGHRWHAVDSDPQFDFNELSRFAGHWVQLETDLDVEWQPSGNAVIYIDRGAGYSEAGALALPQSALASKLLPLIFFVPLDLQGARFDPCSLALPFGFRAITLSVLSKWQAIYQMGKTMRHTGRLRHLRDTYAPRWRSFRTADGAPAGQACVHRIVPRDALPNGAELPRLDPPVRTVAQGLFRIEHRAEVLAPAARHLRADADLEHAGAILDRSDRVGQVAALPALGALHRRRCLPGQHVRQILKDFAKRDRRIKVVLREANGHISAASNSALELATGELLALLDHDDTLHPLALHYVAEALIRNPSAKIIFSDEDKLDASGARHSPYFKCDFNPDLFLAQNMITHLGCYRTEAVRAVGGFREGLEGSQDWDLALRVYEQAGAKEMIHVPRVLYHWRELPGSTALSSDEKPYAQSAGRRAVADHLERMGIAAVTLPAPGLPIFNRIRYAVPTPPPKVSIVIPTRDKVEVLKTAIDSLLKLTTYPNFEIVIIDNGSVEEATATYLSTLPSDHVRVLRDDSPFNYSRLNNRAVEDSSGQFVCLLNNDVEVLNGDWLDEMVSMGSQPQVGIVGARLWYPDHRIQHAGVILGIGGIAGHGHKLTPKGDVGYFGRAALQQQLSAVTGACLLISRAIWDEMGGLDETLSVAFNDVDLCMRVGTAGYRVVWTPFAELIHYESISRGAEDTPEKVARFNMETDLMRVRWGDKLEHDPFYSPNLTLTAEDFSLSWQPRPVR